MSDGEWVGKPKTLQSLTGLNPQEFDKLLKSFKLVWEKILESSVDHTVKNNVITTMDGTVVF